MAWNTIKDGNVGFPLELFGIGLDKSNPLIRFSEIVL